MNGGAAPTEPRRFNAPQEYPAFADKPDRLGPHIARAGEPPEHMQGPLVVPVPDKA